MPSIKYEPFEPALDEYAAPMSIYEPEKIRQNYDDVYYKPKREIGN